MGTLKRFEEFLKQGTARKRMPDQFRAISLIEEAENRKEFLEEIKKLGLKDSNANYFIENCYDILMETLRAKMLMDGFSTSGEGAHEAEVSYMLNLDFSKEEVRFMNELRGFRNGILYYGKRFDAEYGEKVLKFLEKVYGRLLERIDVK